MAELKEIEQLYTTGSISQMFEVSTETVRNWIKDKKLEAVKVGNSWRVPKSALIEFVNNRHGNPNHNPDGTD